MQRKMIFYILCDYSFLSIIKLILNILHVRKIAKKIWKYNYCAICPLLNIFSIIPLKSFPYIANRYLDILEICDVIILSDKWQYNPYQAREYYHAILLNKLIIHESDLDMFLMESNNGKIKEYNYMKKFNYLLNIIEKNIINN